MPYPFNMKTILLSSYVKPVIGPGQVAFALIFLIGFIIVIRWSFNKDRQVNRTNFGNAGLLALVIGGTLLLILIIKIIIRQNAH